VKITGGGSDGDGGGDFTGWLLVTPAGGEVAGVVVGGVFTGGGEVGGSVIGGADVVPVVGPVGVTNVLMMGDTGGAGGAAVGALVTVGVGGGVGLALGDGVGVGDAEGVGVTTGTVAAPCSKAAFEECGESAA
jgi:endoglycosylceramidase